MIKPSPGVVYFAVTYQTNYKILMLIWNTEYMTVHVKQVF